MVRYAIAIAAGIAGAIAWGALMSLIGGQSYAVIGAMLIMLCALVWARS